MSMNILVIGSGGREHALALAFDQSPKTNHVYVAPGNPGMTLNTKKVTCIDISDSNIELLAEFAKDKNVDLTIVGPEHVLEKGAIDYFKEQGLTIVGPSKQASKLESSKSFAKDVINQAGVKSASYRAFSKETAGLSLNYIKDMTYPIVIKEDGLAAGKGVYICENQDQAENCLAELKSKEKHDFIIEDFLDGVEFSHFSLVNHHHVIPLGMARDYKRIYDGGKGPNTGGMGAFSPVTDQDDYYSQLIVDQVVKPVAKEMVDRGTPFTGILFTGLMKVDQDFYVIEFNVRFGDPETQVLLPRIKEDLVDLFEAHIHQRDFSITHEPGVSLGVVIASKGYPGKVEDKKPIIINRSLNLSQVFFAGVSESEETQGLITKGGRVMMVKSQGDTVEACRKQVYELIDQISIDQSVYRTDIGL